MTLDPQADALLKQMAANPLPKLWEVGAAQARAMYEMVSQALDPQGVPIGKTEDISIPGPGGAIPARVYTPVGGGGAAAPCLIYFHGGGFVIGSLQTHDALCRLLANESGAKVVAVDYRLAPEHKFPAAADDCYAAAVWVEQNAASLGVDPNRLAVGGDSAGGNLAAVVCLMAKAKGAPDLRFQLLIYPVTQARAQTESMKAFAEGYFLEKRGMDWFFDQYVPEGHDAADPYLSPLSATDLSGLPKALVITAGFDPLKDEGKAYADKLNAAGVRATYKDYPGMVHGFFNMSGVLDEGKKAIVHAAEALRTALG